MGIHAAAGPDRLQWVRMPRIDIIVEGVPIEAVANTGAGPALIVSKKIAHKILHSRHKPRDAARMITRVGQAITLTNCDGEAVLLAGQAMVEVEYAGVTIITPMLISASAADDATVLIGCFAMLQYGFQLTNHKGEDLLQQSITYGYNPYSFPPLPSKRQNTMVSFACTIRDEAVHLKAGTVKYISLQVPAGTAHTGGTYYFTPSPDLYPAVEIMDGVVSVQSDGSFEVPISNPHFVAAHFYSGDKIGVIEPTATIDFPEWRHTPYHAAITTLPMKRRSQEWAPLDSARKAVDSDASVEQEADDNNNYDLDLSVRPSTLQTTANTPNIETTLPQQQISQKIVIPSSEQQPTSTNEQMSTSSRAPTILEGESADNIDFDFDYERMENRKRKQERNQHPIPKQRTRRPFQPAHFCPPEDHLHHVKKLRINGAKPEESAVLVEGPSAGPPQAPGPVGQPPGVSQFGSGPDPAQSGSEGGSPRPGGRTERESSRGRCGWRSSPARATQRGQLCASFNSWHSNRGLN
ncbi:MAG: hypothetical protein GY821_17090 [Gammaproteobacteria bacterium]|nr:hypothetical protein [Gammaproteobacteria bacterium]